MYDCAFLLEREGGWSCYKVAIADWCVGEPAPPPQEATLHLRLGSTPDERTTWTRLCVGKVIAPFEGLRAGPGGWNPPEKDGRESK